MTAGILMLTDSSSVQHHQTAWSERRCCLDVFVHEWEMFLEVERSVGLSALVFVEMHLLHLLLQEGNGHGAPPGPL